MGFQVGDGWRNRIGIRDLDQPIITVLPANGGTIDRAERAIEGRRYTGPRLNDGSVADPLQCDHSDFLVCEFRVLCGFCPQFIYSEDGIVDGLGRPRSKSAWRRVRECSLAPNYRRACNSTKTGWRPQSTILSRPLRAGLVPAAGSPLACHVPFLPNQSFPSPGSNAIWMMSPFV